MDTRGKSSYQFGAFRLNLADRALLHGTERLDLPPRAFDTLVVLVEERGNLVEKDRLMRTIWPSTVVEENNLSQAVSLLRKVLHDGENGARYIETVPKQGYRFVAPIREMDAREVETRPDQTGEHEPVGFTEANASAAELGLSVVSGNGSGRTSADGLDVQPDLASLRSPLLASKSRWALGGLAVLVIVALLVAGMQLANWRDRQRNRADLETIRSIAVLPLQNFSNDPEQEYFADGMTDELITDLAQVRELRVVSRTSVMQYKGAHRPLPQIGHDLGVDAVIEGSVLRSGNRVRITAQLIRTATDTHLWAKSYEGEMKDVLSLQASVAEAITDEVKLNLTSAERNRLHRPFPVNPEAYEAYLRGRFYWNRRDEQGFAKAVEYFHQAIAKDPDFALPYSGLADCYILMDLNVPDAGKMAQAKAAALKALALDDELAEAHTSLAAVKIFLDWDWAGAESEFNRALELNPNYAPAHHWYGNILLGPLGRHEEAMAELKRAQILDPLSLIINADIGNADYFARHFDAAFQQYQKVLAMDPSFVPAHNDLGRYYAHMGMNDQWLQEAIAISNPQRAQSIRTVYARGGYRGVMLESARSGGTFHVANTSASFFVAAESYAILGQRKQALAALEKSFNAREPGLIYLKVDPVWDSLRTEPAFQSVEHRMGLQ
jgi:TolB-like protein/DNA-binding winged helix-turn-helix (wHTH) protein